MSGPSGRSPFQGRRGVARPSLGSSESSSASPYINTTAASLWSQYYGGGGGANPSPSAGAAAGGGGGSSSFGLSLSSPVPPIPLSSSHSSSGSKRRFDFRSPVNANGGGALGTFSRRDKLSQSSTNKSTNTSSSSRGASCSNRTTTATATATAKDNTTSPAESASSNRAANNNDSCTTFATVDDRDWQNHVRQLARSALETTCVATSGIFYASMLYSKTQTTGDALLYARALSSSHQWRRCLWVLDKSGLYSCEEPIFSLEAVLLGAHCLSNLGEWEDALWILEEASRYQDDFLESADDERWELFNETVGGDVVARLCWHRAVVYDQLSNPTRAASFLQQSLYLDPTCVQAWQHLTQRHLLTQQEQYELVLMLIFPKDMEWLRDMYLAQIVVATKNDSDLVSDSEGRINVQSSIMSEPMTDKSSEEHEPHVANIPNMVEMAFRRLRLHSVSQSPEALSLAAVRSYENYNLRAALKYCNALAEVDPLNPTAGWVRIGTLVGLQHKQSLYKLAHDWVDADPKSAQAWYGVGAYYYLCGHFSVSQKHFCRATRLNPQSAECWIAFGCSFASLDESDQALACFRAAQRLHTGSHPPMLYMGMEYLRTNHLSLASHFLTCALNMSGGDPLCIHELGVLKFRQSEFSEAANWFQRALRMAVQQANLIDASEDDEDEEREIVVARQHHQEQQQQQWTAEESIDLCQDDFWEPTIFNLGQCYRKLRLFPEALRCFEKCLSLKDDPSNYAALGFTRQLMGDMDVAIDLYHQALGRKPDDPFCGEMLNRALQESLAMQPTTVHHHQPEEELSISSPVKRFHRKRGSDAQEMFLDETNNVHSMMMDSGSDYLDASMT